MKKTNRIGVLFILFISALVSSLLSAAEQHVISPEQAEMNRKARLILQNTNALRFLVGEYIVVNQSLPKLNDIPIPQPATELISVVRWTGRYLWIVADETSLGANLVLTLTPKLGSDGEAEWACQSIGSVPDFPRDCTDFIP